MAATKRPLDMRRNQVAFQARSSFAKGNPFSLLFRDPLFGGPLSFFFLGPAEVGLLEMQPEANCGAYLGVVLLQPHACAQHFRFRTRCFLDGRVSGAYQVQ